MFVNELNKNVCARREQKPNSRGLCRAAAYFRASECRAELVRAMPSAAENLKANFRASECRAELVRAMPSAAENIKKTSVENEPICTNAR